MLFEDKHFIAKKIRVARKNAKFTQEELAEKINISSKQLSRIEMAAYIPSLPTFLKIVNILKMDLQDFGVKIHENKNSIKEDFLKIIYGLSDNELKYYYEVVKTMSENSFLLKK